MHELVAPAPIERCIRALIVFTLLTGVRDGATAIALGAAIAAVASELALAEEA
jgi:hypothetical protein